MAGPQYPTNEGLWARGDREEKKQEPAGRTHPNTTATDQIHLLFHDDLLDVLN